MTRIVFLALVGVGIFAGIAHAQFFFPSFPPIVGGPPTFQAPRKDIFILNAGSVAILNRNIIK